MRILSLAFCLAANASWGANVQLCGEEAGAANILQPWEAHSRTFANGRVRIAILDTSEPAAAAFYLLVLSPPRDDFGQPSCQTIGFAPGMGYAEMSLTGLKATYDAGTGLMLDVASAVHNPETSLDEPGVLSITLNLATGEISARDIGS
ncbi:MAG: hypothetical protein QNJ20_09875 [Paracoccaceae bacterium]|nr:hypothetical protein [Paracoccaceae bacterium]